MELKTYKTKMRIVRAFQWLSKDNPPPTDDVPGLDQNNPYVEWQHRWIEGREGRQTLGRSLHPYAHSHGGLVTDKDGNDYINQLIQDGDWAIITYHDHCCGKDKYDIQLMEPEDFYQEYEEIPQSEEPNIESTMTLALKLRMEKLAASIVFLGQSVETVKIAYKIRQIIEEVYGKNPA